MKVRCIDAVSSGGLVVGQIYEAEFRFNGDHGQEMWHVSGVPYLQFRFEPVSDTIPAPPESTGAFVKLLREEVDAANKAMDEAGRTWRSRKEKSTMTKDDLNELEFPSHMAKASGFKQVTIDVDHVLSLIAAARELEELQQALVLLRDWETRTPFGEVGMPQLLHDGTYRMYAVVPGQTPVIGQGPSLPAVAQSLCLSLGLLPKGPTNGR